MHTLASSQALTYVQLRYIYLVCGVPLTHNKMYQAVLGGQRQQTGLLFRCVWVEVLNMYQTYTKSTINKILYQGVMVLMKNLILVIPAGAKTVYAQDRPGSPKHEYESGAYEFSSNIERKHSDLIAALDTRSCDEFICLKACPQEHIKLLQCIIKMIASSNGCTRSFCMNRDTDPATKCPQ